MFFEGVPGEEAVSVEVSTFGVDLSISGLSLSTIVLKGLGKI